MSLYNYIARRPIDRFPASLFFICILTGYREFNNIYKAVDRPRSRQAISIVILTHFGKRHVKKCSLVILIHIDNRPVKKCSLVILIGLHILKALTGLLSLYHSLSKR